MIAPTPARLAALAIPLLALLAACGDGDDGASPVVNSSPSATTATTSPPLGATTDTTAPPGTTTVAGTTVTITVRGGSVEGPSRQRVPLNQRVTIRVTSDVADEVHVHGYDRTVDVTPNTPAEVSFVANIPGVFEVEFERSHRRLTTLEVQP